MATRLLFLLAIVAVGQCALLGSKKCTYGPSYWCSHLHQAKECSAFQHCLTTVWATQTPGMTGTTETCFAAVNALDVVRSASDAELMNHMAMACTSLPAEHRAQCKEFVKNDQDEIFLLLKSDLPSSTIASTLGFCGGFEDTVPHPGQVAEFKVTGDYCTDCVNFFGDLREIFNNSESQALGYLKNLICPRLGSLEDLCNQLIDQYAALVIDTIYQQLNPEDICYMLQMCKNQTRQAVMEKFRGYMEKVSASNVTCTLCKDAAKAVQDALRDQDLQRTMMGDIENVLCPLLPLTMAQSCKTYVEAYGPLAFQLIVAEMDPDSFCQMMNICSQQAKELPVVRLGLSSATTNVRVVELEKKVKAGPTCALCEYAMEKLIGMLKKNATEEEIKAALDKVCSLLPASLSGECAAFVDEYAPMVIKLLLEEVAPQAVCTLLHLCVGDKPEPVKVLALQLGSEECTLCEIVIGYVNEELKDNTKTVEQVLDEVCNVVPSAYRDLCQQLINAYAPQIIQILTQYDDPVKVCTALGLCTSSKNQINTSKPQVGAPLLFQPMQEIRPARHLVGTDKCSYGPDYWCASRENAARCNIPVEHCQTKYGKKINA